MSPANPLVRTFLRLGAFAVGLAAIGFAFALLSAFARGVFIANHVPEAYLPFADAAVGAIMLSLGLVLMKLAFFVSLPVRVFLVGVGFVIAGVVAPRVVEVPAALNTPLAAVLPVLDGSGLPPPAVLPDPDGAAPAANDAPPSGWVHGTRDVARADVEDGVKLAAADLAAPAFVDDDRRAVRVRPAELRALEVALVDEVNRVRAGPHAYVPFAEARRATIDDAGVLRTAYGLRVKTMEGAGAVTELIDALSATSSMPLLTRDRALDASARDHALDLGDRGALGHVSSDGARLAARVARRGPKAGLGEAIAYGMDDARDIVFALLVDDGVPGRGHRALLLDPTFSEVGAACTRHRALAIVCVLDFAQAGLDPGKEAR